MTRLNPIVFIIILFILNSCTDISFDSEEWKNWKENESNMHIRWDMTDDLIQNYNLVGKTHQEIEKLLGKPSSGVSNSENNYFYDLGPCRRGINYGSLHLVFKNGQVDHVNKSCD